jgi:hypothetical protein
MLCERAILWDLPFPVRLCVFTKLALSLTGIRNQYLTSRCGFWEVSRLEKLHHAVRTLADVCIEQCAA